MERNNTLGWLVRQGSVGGDIQRRLIKQLVYSSFTVKDWKNGEFNAAKLRQCSPDPWKLLAPVPEENKEMDTQQLLAGSEIYFQTGWASGEFTPSECPIIFRLVDRLENLGLF